MHTSSGGQSNPREYEISLSAAYDVGIVRAVYRLYLHPLSHYPGPRLAAIPKPWYERYWNFYQNGLLLFEIDRLHQRLGPVIRIAPNELHINDPEVFLEMTKISSQFTKDPNFYDFITFPSTSVGETDPVCHRIRRQVLTPAFSPSRVQEMAPMVKSKADHLLGRFEEFANRDEPVSMFRGTKAFMMDVISSVVFGKEMGCIADPDFRNKFIEYLHVTFEMGWTATAFPNLTRFSLFLPGWLSESLFPVPIMELKKKCIGLMDSYLRERDAPTVGSQSNKSEERDFNRSIIIDLLVDPASARDQFHERVTKELATTFPDTREEITYDKAKELPYLTVIIKEILRYSSPLPGKAPRVPDLFLPERWLAADASHLEKYMTSFYRGTRQCFGKEEPILRSLAYCEMYTLLANLFRRFKLETYYTTDADMQWIDLLMTL
ncbi:cytochrome P450 [Lentithecium fluviatile CBS 122367]|uniref:Cytochrome P450 n=1 Tax=Lentithecium fluviatile CBS 122367 TaxID=1168545 RepID=A0A6G1IV18_9PLEO|nr:cytochrome P450 [Lentithecium fluviatile CBS 122367]